MGAGSLFIEPHIVVVDGCLARYSVLTVGHVGRRVMRWDELTWAVAQLGAREHYAVARGLHADSRLARMYTDFWAYPSCRFLARRSGRLSRMGTRWHPDLPGDRVSSFPLHMLYKIVSKPSVQKSPVARLQAAWYRSGQLFASSVARDLRRRGLTRPERCGFFGYSIGSLEALELAAEFGMLGVVDQMDAGRAHFVETAREAELWPGWAQHPGPSSEEYFDRIRREWSAASLVVVNSQWSKQAAVREGCAESKIAVIPLAYEGETVGAPRVVDNRDRGLHVLWLGRVDLGKGIPYLIEAARMLPHVRFTVAGGIAVNPARIATVASNVTILGHVNRESAKRLYSTADVFVLPTLSDGFAITQLEAMAHGLPVIATNRCGEVVTDSQDGFIVPVRDAVALAGAISRIDDDRGLLSAMSERALRTAQRFTVQRYVRELESAVRAVPA